MNHADTPERTETAGSSERLRDWRFWVGGTGRILLAIGVLMFGFVAYQLWGTGIEYQQHQDDLAKQFRERQQELFGDTAPTSDSVPTGDTATNGSTAVSEPGSGLGTGELATPTTFPKNTGKPKKWPKPAPGDALAIISIPKIHKRVYAVSGVAAKDLKKGLGHYARTPLPGQLGNSAFAGHRTTFGAPLFDIDKLAIGDDIVVDTLTNQRFVYVVSSAPVVVSATAGWVVETADRDVATLTLTSCHPKYSAKERIVVVATLDPARSGPVERPNLDETPSTTTSTTTPATTTLATTVPQATSTPATAVGSATTVTASNAAQPSTSAIPETVAPAETDPATSETGEDQLATGESQLSHGWFDDSAAWWHVIGWGLLDASIVAGGWLLARRTKRWWLGLAVAAVPFLLVLYFVYQNVNRLLPADL